MESGKRSYLFVVVALLALSTLTFSTLIFSTQASSNLFAAPFGAQESDGDVSSDENEPDELEGLVASGEYEFAEEVIRERLEKNKEDVVTLRALAEVFAAQGKYDESLVELAKYPAAQKSADVLAMVGQIHARVGKLAESERSFRAALTLNSSHVESLNRLGQLFERTGRLDEAKRQWNKIVEVYEAMSIEQAEEASAEMYTEMGVALRSLNRYHDANEIMFPQARDQDDESSLLLLEWGRTYMDKYDYPFARDLLRRCLDINPGYADARVLMAKNYLTDFQVGTKRYGLAEKQLKNALETNPKHAGAYAALGALWLSDGDLTRAVKQSKKALEVDPTHAEALAQLAACYRLMGGMEEEFASVEKRMLGVNPKAAAFYHTVALAIERRFRYHGAAEMSEKALALNPDFWPAFHTLGINYLRIGKEEQGREYLQKSFDNDPFNVWVVNTRKLLRYVDKNHRQHKTDLFHFRFPRADYAVLKSLLVPLMEDAHKKLSEHYKVELEKPIYIDVFSNHQWFSARIVGLGGFPATGACFGNVVALTTPKALPQNWGAVAWHEFAHVVTLHATKNRVPRWLTEGLSVYEEGRDHKVWTRNFTREIADNFGSGRLLPIAELDSGFSKPKYPGQVLISYYQGCLVVDYITQRWSFDKVLAILDGYKERKATTDIFDEVLDLSLQEFDQGFFSWLGEWVESNGYAPALTVEVAERLEIESESKPDDAKLLTELAWAYYCTGNEVDTPITAQKVLKLEPDNGDALAILGFTDMREKKEGTAKKRFEKALEAGTRFQYRVTAQLAQIALSSNDKEKAIELFEKARAISPKAGSASRGGGLYYQLSELYAKAGEDEKAMAVLEDLRAIAVEDARCRVTLAKHYAQQDSVEAKKKAFRALDEVMYINPFDNALHKQLAAISSELGEHAVAIREYNYLLSVPGTNPKAAYLALAKAHLGLDEKEKAKEYAQKVLAIDEENEEAQEVLEKAES